MTRRRRLQNPAGSPPILNPLTIEVECLESNQAIRRRIHEELIRNRAAVDTPVSHHVSVWLFAAVQFQGRG